MTCDSSSLSAGTRWVWIILRRKARRPWTDPVHGWSAAARTEPPHVLRLALSPSCWVSSACLPRPSPKKASIKSPLKTTTGLDSHKLEQNNLFFFSQASPPPLLFAMPSPVPHLHACSDLSHIVSGRGCEHRREAESPSCLRMHTVLMWADSIRQHFWLPHTPLPFTACLPILVSSCTNVFAMTRQTRLPAELHPFLLLFIYAVGETVRLTSARCNSHYLPFIVVQNIVVSCFCMGQYGTSDRSWWQDDVSL